MNLAKYGILSQNTTEIVESFLKHRGIDADQVDEIFQPSYRLLNDVTRMENVTKWFNVLSTLKDSNLVVVGDYDVDGIMSAAVAYEGLKVLGIGTNLHKYVPRRELGYGLSVASVDEIMTLYPNTTALLTVDNGVAAFDGVKYAKELGLTVLVSDHHLGATFADNTPNDVVADAVVDINRVSDQYAFKGLSGAGMIWKLLVGYAQIVLKDQILTNKVAKLVDLVGISVISDIMPLRNENRLFVTMAISELLQPTRLAWRAFIQVLRDKKLLYGTIDASTIGFTIAPILNSASRMTGTPQLCYDLFDTDDYQTAYDLVVELIELNTQRKSVSAKLTNDVIDRYANQDDVKAIVVKTDVIAGIAGLIAGRLTEHFECPSIVFGNHVDKDGYVHGSARSTEWFDIYQALKTLEGEGLIVQFGGHAAAAGVTIKPEMVDQIQTRLAQLVSTSLKHVHPKPVHYDILIEHNYDTIIGDYLSVDGTLVNSDDLVSLVRVFDLMAPFGQGFSAPTVRVDGVTFADARKMGKENQHIKLQAGALDILKWNVGNVYDDVSMRTNVSVVGSLGINEWRGNYKPQLMADKIMIEGL